MGVGDQSAPGHLGASQTSALPRRLRDRRHFIDRCDCNGVDRKVAHHSLQHLTSEVQGKSFSNPTNTLGCCPTNDGILSEVQNKFASEGGRPSSTLSWIARKRSSSMPSISSGTSASSSSVLTVWCVSVETNDFPSNRTSVRFISNMFRLAHLSVPLNHWAAGAA